MKNVWVLRLMNRGRWAPFSFFSSFCFCLSELVQSPLWVSWKEVLAHRERMHASWKTSGKKEYLHALERENPWSPHKFTRARKRGVMIGTALAAGVSDIHVMRS